MMSHFHGSLLVRFALLTLSVMAVVADHASEHVNRVNVIRVPGNAKVVKAQLGAEGTLHLLLDAEDGPRYVKSTDGGVTFSTPMAIVDAASLKPGLKFQGEDLAVGKDGSVHVAMSNNAWKLKLPEEEWGFYYASLASGAKAFSPVRNLNRKPSEGFSLAADDRGDVTACFLSGKLFTMVSHDNGETFSDYIEPNPTWDPCNCCTTAAAYGADGKLALLYREETNNERDMFVVLSNQRTRSKPRRCGNGPVPDGVAPSPEAHAHRQAAGPVRRQRPEKRHRRFLGQVDGRARLARRRSGCVSPVGPRTGR